MDPTHLDQPSTSVPPSDAGTADGVSLFAVLWGVMSDLVGKGATAILVRRAAQRAAASSEPVAGLRIERAGTGYAYSLPPSWSTPDDPEGAQPVRALVETLGPLLVVMTGPVVVRRLAEEPLLRAAGLITDEDLSRWLGGR